MDSSSASTCSIFDVPDEILVRIFSHINTMERLWLANSCTRFNSIVLRDPELVRDLDFSENCNSTTLADIQRYFSNEDTCKLVRKINTRNVECMKQGHVLNNSIGRATNLVDINIHGTTFEEAEELGSFLEPLLHLKRLSVDWPKSENANVVTCRKFLQKPLSKLTYLSVQVRSHGRMFLPTVQLCEELEELRMVTVSPMYSCSVLRSPERVKLRNLKIVQFRGLEESARVKKELISTILDPCEWTDCYMARASHESYFERNLEVCEELREVTEMPPPLGPPSGDFCLDDEIFWYFCEDYGHQFNDMGGNLFSEHLLRKVITVTHEHAPEKYCCLNDYGEAYYSACELKIDEAKQLLQDPRHQISYLHFIHDIEQNCDAHLVASAFPHLAELVLHEISTRNVNANNWDPEWLPNLMEPFRRRLRKRGSTALVEVDDPTNPDSSFTMLVENTPQLKRLSILSKSRYGTVNDWDLEALRLIPLWKNLTYIHLVNIPITDGKFLTEIGKECRKLEEVRLYDLGVDRQYCYGSDLLQMLRLCDNLRKFSIIQPGMNNMAEVFSALSSIPKLQTVRVMSRTETYDSPELASSVEQLLHGCPELTRFVFVLKSGGNRVNDEIKPVIERIAGELNRPNFEFCDLEHIESEAFRRGASTSFFPSASDEAEYYSWKLKSYE